MTIYISSEISSSPSQAAICVRVNMYMLRQKIKTMYIASNLILFIYHECYLMKEKVERCKAEGYTAPSLYLMLPRHPPWKFAIGHAVEEKEQESFAQGQSMEALHSLTEDLAVCMSDSQMNLRTDKTR